MVSLKSIVFAYLPVINALDAHQAFLSRPKEIDQSQVGVVDPNFCQNPSGAIDDACGATFGAVDSVNRRIRPLLNEIVDLDYFRFYRINLYSDACTIPEFTNNGVCGNRACAVETVEDESALPLKYRSMTLGKLADHSVTKENPRYVANGQDDDSSSSIQTDDDDEDDDESADREPVTRNSQNTESNSGSASCISDYDNSLTCESDVDYCRADGEDPSAVFVNLRDNPERYTGYVGGSIWKYVYGENCFEYKGPTDNVESIDNTQCVEQRIFFRLISGMHSSISTHLSANHLDTNTGIWGPNLDKFMKMVGAYPDRISNLYFNYAMIARSISKLRPYMDKFHFCPHDNEGDLSTRKYLYGLARDLSSPNRPFFNETLVFATHEGKALKKEFRTRFRNVAALMNCVGCDRCRLWGKLQAVGYGTALKILFELPESNEDSSGQKVMADLKRTELVALINTFDRLSLSVQAIQTFRDQVRLQLGKPAAEDHDFASDLMADDLNEEVDLVNEEKTSHSSLYQEVQDAWHEELNLAWSGLKFILRSYVDFPRNLWHLFLQNSLFYWNKLIGRSDIFNSYDGTRARLDL